MNGSCFGCGNEGHVRSLPCRFKDHPDYDPKFSADLGFEVEDIEYQILKHPWQVTVGGNTQVCFNKCMDIEIDIYGNERNSHVE